ncbi:ParB N-terminal domain-containing protein [Streptomyces sp. ID05-39B]|uniref:ParB/RepB/Spo0J family partition protein n=1 Tax=Streptomyces sp. ID05-39B TaxID=3028664 RepID=UPI0029AB4DB5|nr:ParB N-terminal domain-containing protein [Streptomyces sp. ID05-39B]MDX3531942.1 ParB N-terminal domain-containing protein [Streptomyces sp. ID05-39B]
MAGRRTSLASLAGEKVDDVPGKSDPLLLSLPLNKLVPTRFNPRRRFGTEEELREFGQKLAREQLQPAVVVSRTAYLKLWPEEADHVGDASYVIANGERRYRASLLVGRPALEVVHKEDVASSRAAFLDAVQSENNDRENLDPIERALGIDIMVTQIGGADQVAVYYGKTKGWVSQQRKLLKLTPELQDLVSSGELPVRVARDIAGLPAEVQATAWEEELERRRLEKEAGARLRGQKKEERFTAVNQTPPGRPKTVVQLPPVPDRFTAVNQESPTPQAPAAPATPVPVQPGTEQQVPEQRATPQSSADTSSGGEGGEGQPRWFPYEEPATALMLIETKMPDEHLISFVEMVYRMAERKGITPRQQSLD